MLYLALLMCIFLVNQAVSINEKIDQEKQINVKNK